MSGRDVEADFKKLDGLVSSRQMPAKRTQIDYGAFSDLKGRTGGKNQSRSTQLPGAFGSVS